MEPEKIRILLIEDNPGDVRLIREFLDIGRDPAFSLEATGYLAQGLEALARGHFHVVLLDLSLPDSQGFETFLQLQEKVPAVPIVVLTGNEDETLASRIIRGKGQDFLDKGALDRRCLSRAIRNAVDRHALQNALQASESRLRRMIENNPDGMVVLDDAGKVQFANPAAERLFGKGSKELADLKVGCPVVVGGAAEILIPQGSGGAVTAEFRVEEIRWEGASATLLTIRDVTERKRSEEALRDSEAKYRRLFESSKDGILILDYETGEIQEVNQALMSLIEYSSEELVGKNLWTIEAFSLEFGTREIFLNLLNLEYIRFEEFQLIRKDGRISYVEWVSNFYRVGGKPMIQCSIRDITRRKLAEERVRLNEARLEGLLRIHQFSAKDPARFLDFALSEGLSLTGSRFGYIYHYFEDRQEFVLNTWSKEVMATCSIPTPPTVCQLEKTGFWGEVVRQRKTIVVNDFQAAHPLKKGYPEGHAPLTRFASIPIWEAGKIVAVVGMANKEAPYEEDDLRQLQLLMESTWLILERKKAEAQLEAKLRELERFNSLTVDREIRMIELKKEINELLTRHGEPEKYRIVG